MVSTLRLSKAVGLLLGLALGGALGPAQAG